MRSGQEKPSQFERTVVFIHLRLRARAAGFSQRQIASATGVNRRTVNRIVQAFRHEGRIEDAPRGRPPRRTTEEEVLIIVAAFCDDPFMTVKELKTCLNIRASVTTIRQRLQEARIRSREAAQKPLLCERHRTARKSFPEDHQPWGPSEWNQVVFTDDASFCSPFDQQRRVWKPGIWR
ncbi:hypothetical protein HPB47_027275 [Ixodes persulcatus]|uniref:Uncharacterized protein n=1 Tax=Ixodes persulcatus TaxID=34615 RepID=A0AC60PYS6_IXOPE|nr:hypothetical protein HPB47_027275 [Ixodes persulcatus]